MIRTVRSACEGEYKIAHSKFVSYLLPLKGKEEVRPMLISHRKMHPKANHVCFAYRYGFVEEETRSSDDGEPSGSAGKPILNQLLSHQLQNCLLIVVRYFGGTKLGVSGLIDAYKMASANAIRNATIISMEEMLDYTIHINHDKYHALIQAAKNLNVEVKEQSFLQDSYMLRICTTKEKWASINNIIQSI